MYPLGAEGADGDRGAFRASASQREDDGILGLEDINRKAEQIRGDEFPRSIRYSAHRWEDGSHDLLSAVR